MDAPLALNLVMNCHGLELGLALDPVKFPKPCPEIDSEHSVKHGLQYSKGIVSISCVCKVVMTMIMTRHDNYYYNRKDHGTLDYKWVLL